jgi:hypothetical protein
MKGNFNAPGAKPYEGPTTRSRNMENSDPWFWNSTSAAASDRRGVVVPLGPCGEHAHTLNIVYKNKYWPHSSSFLLNNVVIWLGVLIPATPHPTTIKIVRLVCMQYLASCLWMINDYIPIMCVRVRLCVRALYMQACSWLCAKTTIPALRLSQCWGQLRTSTLGIEEKTRLMGWNLDSAGLFSRLHLQLNPSSQLRCCALYWRHYLSARSRLALDVVTESSYARIKCRSRYPS